MKQFIFTILICASFAACKKDNSVANTSFTPMGHTIIVKNIATGSFPYDNIFNFFDFSSPGSVTKLAWNTKLTYTMEKNIITMRDADGVSDELEIENGKPTHYWALGNEFKGREFIILTTPDKNQLRGKEFAGTLSDSKKNIKFKEFHYSFNPESNQYSAWYVTGINTKNGLRIAYYIPVGNIALWKQTGSSGIYEQLTLLNGKLLVEYYDANASEAYYATFNEIK